MQTIWIIVIIALADIANGSPINGDRDELNHLNLMKQSLTIRQIRNKLFRYYSNRRNEFNSREIRYRNGGSNIWEEKSNINDILESIVFIKPHNNPADDVYKKEVILFGRIENQSRNGLLVDFDLQPHHLSANSVFLRLFTHTTNKYFVRWQVSNNYNNIKVKRQTVLSTNSNQLHYYHIPIGELTRHENGTPNSTMDDNDERTVRFSVKMRPAIDINMAMLWVEMDVRKLYPQLKSNGPVYNANKTKPHITCLANQVFCCLQNFSISPSEIGMDNIRNQDKISLNYCRGECNSNFPRVSTHRKLLDIFRHSNSSRLSPLKLSRMRSCCSPSRYADLEVQYYNRPNKEVIPNMIITACGCH